MAHRKSKSDSAGRAKKVSTQKGRKPANRKRAAKQNEAAVSAAAKILRLDKKPAAKTSASAKANKALATPVSGAGLTKLVKRLRDDLGSNHHPAWLIDIGAELLIPLNDAGAKLFANDTMATESVRLESDMPALKKLRQLDGKKPQKKKHAPRRTEDDLVFWTSEGVYDAKCLITRHRVKGRTLFFVQSERHCDMTQSGATSNEAPPSDQPRDDAAILREIARRIRAGTSVDLPLTDAPGELPSPVQDQERAFADTQPQPVEAAHQTIRSSIADPNRDQRAKLAHELRTPLSAIVAAAEVLKDERLGILDNYHYRDYARDIHQSARHALDLIERGLNLDISSDNTPIKPPFSDRADLNHLVRSALATVKHLAETSDISLTFEPAERDAWLQFDPTSITQIVLNLLTNAVKFTPPGGQVTAKVCANIGEDVYVEVKDNGPGMSKTEISRHLQGSPQKPLEARPKGGLGIGLALSRQLAEDNGATLNIESIPGRGTTARLAFPLRHLMAV